MGDNNKISRLSGGLQPVSSKQVQPHSEADTTGLSEKDLVRRDYQRERDLSKIRVIPARPESSPFDPRYRKRVVVYCRVSTDGIQQTTSFELQKKHYLKYVRKNPEWKLVGLYSDEGITATSMEKRVGLLTMLSDARAGKFDIIVVKNLSRLSRNLMDCMNIIYELRQLPHPVGILFETENMFTLDKNVDFTLQVLSLVAQEESHKKSEAMNSSYQARFANGQFMKPDLLGYDRAGKNEISINVEEARTVQLIFMMYLAQTSPQTIAEVLTMLGRKTHTHKYKDGRIKEGIVQWTAGSVLNILKNERRCGNVLAQKTFTPNYLDHKSKTNYDTLPKYYAVDQHPAIVSPDDFFLTQKMIAANRGGWRLGLQQLEVYESGFMCGCVSTVPNWLGFRAEDYNKAALFAEGFTEEQLSEIEVRIEAANGTGISNANETPGFQHMFSIDSDDYDLYPEADDDKEEMETENDRESFLYWVNEVRAKKTSNIDVKKISSYDLSKYEIVRAEYFNSREKASVRFDSRGILFNRSAYSRLTAKSFDTEYVEITYNPIEQMIFVKPTNTPSAKTVKWASRKENAVSMRRSSIKGLADAIFTNMGWNGDYKYKILGTVIGSGEDFVLAFCLSEYQAIVPARFGSDMNIDTDSENALKKEFQYSGSVSMQSFIPDLSSFEFGEGPSLSTAKRLSRSRAIYYDELMDQNSGTISISQIEDRKYDPEFIRRLIEKGMEPIEGWSYLAGVATIGKKSFTIYPLSWVGSFGAPFYSRPCLTLMDRVERLTEKTVVSPYGWTLGLDLPNQTTVDEAIEYLRQDAAS